MIEPTSPDPNEHGHLASGRQAKRHRWALFGVVVLVFLAGMVAGGAMALHTMTDRFHFRPKDPRAVPHRITRHMQRKLDLTDQQAQQVESILTRRFESLLALRRDLRPRIHAHFQQTENEVAQVLAPQQSRKWRKWFTRRFREHWPPARLEDPSSGPGRVRRP